MFERKKRKPAEINLIPLINVIFLLLIFFLVAGTMNQPDNDNLSLPKAETGDTSIKGSITIVLKNDEMLFNDMRTTRQDIDKALKLYLSKDQEQKIVIKADENVEAEAMVSLLESISNAGGVNVSIVARAR